jgi:hypothetical protein
MEMQYEDRETLLILCDISGYTRFMSASGHARIHSYVVVTELMRAALKEVRSPIQVSKLEGDALFLYSWWPRTDRGDAELACHAQETVSRIFAAFASRRAMLAAANVCPCEACCNVEGLELKVVIHSGRAAAQRIGRFHELAGIDVIMAHRLLKNSVEASSYVLFTETAWRAIQPSGLGDHTQGIERYEELGDVATYMFAPPAEAAACTLPRATVLQKAGDILNKIGRSRLMRMGLIRRPRLTNADALAAPAAK